MELRYYQREAIDAVFEFYKNEQGNPLIDAPTGSGKSVIIGSMCREIMAEYDGIRIVMLTHVKE